MYKKLLVYAFFVLQTRSAWCQAIAKLDAAEIERINQSIVQIHAADNSSNPAKPVPQFSTGFVVAVPDPVNASTKKIIVTSGHVLSGGLNVRALVAKEAEVINLDLLDYSDEFDLVALVPHGKSQLFDSIKPLEIQTTPNLNFKELPPVLVFGYVGWLDHRVTKSCSIEKGEINGPPFLAKDFQHYLDLQRKSPARGLVTPRGKAQIIRHTARTYEGVSGGPLIDSHGKVIGLSTAVLLDSENGNRPLNGVSFAVNIKHLYDLQLNATPDTNFTKAKTVLPKLTLSKVTKNISIPALQYINVGQRSLLLGINNEGVLLGAASNVIDELNLAQQSFRADFGEKRLQGYLAREELQLFDCPGFRFRMLVPKAFVGKLDTLELKHPRGFRTVFTNSDQAVPIPYGQLNVSAILVEDLLADYQEQWKNVVKERFSNLSEAQIAADPTTRNKCLALRKWFGAKCAIEYLERKILEPKATDTGFENYLQKDDHGKNAGATFQRLCYIADSRAENQDSEGSLSGWARAIYVSLELHRVIEVHCGIWNNRAVIVTFAAPLEDHLLYLNHAQPSKNYLDIQLLKSSISFY